MTGSGSGAEGEAAAGLLVTGSGSGAEGEAAAGLLVTGSGRGAEGEAVAGLLVTGRGRGRKLAEWDTGIQRYNQDRAMRKARCRSLKSTSPHRGRCTIRYHTMAKGHNRPSAGPVFQEVLRRGTLYCRVTRRLSCM